MIPRVLHQIWVSGIPPRPCPDRLAGYAARWQELHPDWSHVWWSDESLDWLFNRDLFDRAIEIVPPHSVGQLRADIARWEILRHYGGVYVDVDFEPIRPINELCDRPWVTESAARTRIEGGRPLVANGLIALPPQHDLAVRMIAAVRDACERADGSRQASRVSGPWLLSRMLIDDDVEVRPADEFYPYRWDELSADYVTDGCYAVHHWWHQRAKRGLSLP